MYPAMPAGRSDVDDTHARIRRLEDNQFEIQTTVTASQVRLESLDEKVDSMDGKLDKILEGLEKQGTRIGALEMNESHRSNRWKWISGVASAVVIAVIVAILGLK